MQESMIEPDWAPAPRLELRGEPNGAFLAEHHGDGRWVISLSRPHFEPIQPNTPTMARWDARPVRYNDKATTIPIGPDALTFDQAVQIRAWLTGGGWRDLHKYAQSGDLEEGVGSLVADVYGDTRSVRLEQRGQIRLGMHAEETVGPEMDARSILNVMDWVQAVAP